MALARPLYGLNRNDHLMLFVMVVMSDNPIVFVILFTFADGVSVGGRHLLQTCFGNVESSCFLEAPARYNCDGTYYASCYELDDGSYCCTSEIQDTSSDDESPTFDSSSDNDETPSLFGGFFSGGSEQTDDLSSNIQESVSQSVEDATGGIEDQVQQSVEDSTGGIEDQVQQSVEDATAGIEEEVQQSLDDAGVQDDSTSEQGCEGTVDDSCQQTDEGIYECEGGYYESCYEQDDGSYCCTNPTEPSSTEQPSDSETLPDSGDQDDSEQQLDTESYDNGDQGEVPDEDQINQVSNDISKTIEEISGDTIDSLLDGSTEVKKEEVDGIAAAIVSEDKLGDTSALDETARKIGDTLENKKSIPSAATACAWGILKGKEKIYATSYAYTAITVIKTKTITVSYNVISSFAIAIASVYKTDPAAAQRATLAFAEAIAQSGDCNIYIVQIIQVFMSVVTTVVVQSKEIIYIFG